MPGCSPLTLAKRAFVKVLLSLAAAHSVSVGVNRDSEEKALLTAYRLVAKKVHPDKGGTKKEFTKLQAAKETWEKALKETAPRGRPRPATANPTGQKRRIHWWWRTAGGSKIRVAVATRV